MSGGEPAKINEIPATLLCILNIMEYEKSQRSVHKKGKSESETEEKYIL